MITERKLTEEEFNLLLEEAPETETRNLKQILGDGAYDYFDIFALEHFGLVNNERPIYFGALVLENGLYEIWTVVNCNVNEQFSLFKFSKRKMKSIVEKYGDMYATMEKVNKKNIEWTKRIGFEQVAEDDGLITLVFRG